MGKTLAKECPICAYPLDSKSFCSRCHKKPSYPPFRGLSFNRGGGVGAGVFANIIIVKRYEFDDQWQNRVTSSNEVMAISSERAFDTIARWHGYQSWVEYAKANPENFKAALQQAKELSRCAYDALLESEDVQKIVVELTKWEEYYEEQAQTVSAIRVSEGVYFGLTDTSRAAFKALFAFISLDLGSWFEIVKKVGGAGFAVKKLFNVYQRFYGNEKVVFESIHKFSAEVRRINFDEHHHSPHAYGYQGPTLHDLENLLAGQLTSIEIRDALDNLKEQNVVYKKKEMWHIRF